MSSLVHKLPGDHQVTKLNLAGTARQLLRPQGPHPEHAAEAKVYKLNYHPSNIQITRAGKRPQP